jgi:hypothetical protein
MRKIILPILVLLIASKPAISQLAVFKRLDKNASESNIGFGAFAYWDIPLNEIGNRSVVVELMDLAYFPPKDNAINPVIGYLSIKAGYKYVFSDETKTGFYIEPSAGICRVVNEDQADGNYGDGLALALEGGYTLEVGQRGNSLNFGLKFESDLAGSDHTISALGFRVSYSFHMFRRRQE